MHPIELDSPTPRRVASSGRARVRPGWILELLAVCPIRAQESRIAAQRREVEADVPAVLVQSGHRQAVYAVAVSYDGSIAVGGQGQNLSIWDVQHGKEIGKLVKHTAPVRSLEFCPTRDLLISAGGDNLVVVWDLAARKLVASLSDPLGVFSSVALSPDCHSAFLGNSHGPPLLWDFTASSEAPPRAVSFLGAQKEGR